MQSGSRFDRLVSSILLRLLNARQNAAGAAVAWGNGSKAGDSGRIGFEPRKMQVSSKLSLLTCFGSWIFPCAQVLSLVDSANRA